MRVAAILALTTWLTACSGGEFNPSAIDVDRLPLTEDGDFFLGRTIEW